MKNVVADSIERYIFVNVIVNLLFFRDDITVSTDKQEIYKFFGSTKQFKLITKNNFNNLMRIKVLMLVLPNRMIRVWWANESMWRIK